MMRIACLALLLVAGVATAQQPLPAPTQPMYYQNQTPPTVVLPAPRINVSEPAPIVNAQPAPPTNVQLPPSAVNIVQQSPIVNVQQAPRAVQYSVPQVQYQASAPIQYSAQVYTAPSVVYAAPVCSTAVCYAAPVAVVRSAVVVSPSTTVIRTGIFGRVKSVTVHQ